jgi:hypothetical protein
MRYYAGGRNLCNIASEVFFDVMQTHNLSCSMRQMRIGLNVGKHGYNFISCIILYNFQLLCFLVTTLTARNATNCKKNKRQHA